MNAATTTVVLTDCYGGKRTQLSIPEDTTEMEVPFGCSFSALGALPNHLHDYQTAAFTVASFVPRSQCKRCTGR